MTLADIRDLCPDKMTYGRARFLQANGRVRRSAEGPGGTLRAQVVDTSALFSVTIQMDARGRDLDIWRCTCGRRKVRQNLCCHAAAVLIDAVGGEPEAALLAGAGDALLAQFDPPPAKEECLRLQAVLRVTDGCATLGIRAGVRRLYVVKDLLQFHRAMNKELPLRFGNATVIDPSTQAVRQQDAALMRFLQEALAEYALFSDTAHAMRELPLTESRLHALLEAIASRPFALLLEGEKRMVHGVQEGALPLAFSMSQEGNMVCLRLRMPKDIRPLTEDAAYLYTAGNVHHLPPEAAIAVRPFCLAKEEVYRFSGAGGAMLLSEVLPQLRRAFPVEVEEALAKRLIEHPLQAQVRLDLVGEEIVANVNFHYGESTVDPFSPAEGAGSEKILLRDPFGERQVLDTLSRYGFRVRVGCAYLRDDGRLYTFLQEGVVQLQQCAEVLVGQRLLAARPRRVRPRGRLSIQGGRLHFDLALQEIPPGDYPAILQALLETQRFVRLEDGAFLTLSKEDGWEALADGLREADGVVEEGALWMDRTRAAWLDAVLEGVGADVERDEAVLAIAKALREPKKHPLPAKGLRPYQRTGFDWLCTLAELGMGGILADDMGLGKTLQALALLEWTRKKEATKKPSLVVAPTSLLYNWMQEVKKFTPGLTAIALRGDAQQRRTLAQTPCDVMITTYAQLRRDVEFLEGIPFRYVILDEAQHIKNAASLGAEAAKRLTAEARFALTGTPMENHVGEVWSLFDFILPGYLGELPTFMRRYGEGMDAEGLAKRIRPFLMRRIKRDVLPELPEKLESRVAAEMSAQQQEIYFAELHAAQQGLRERFLQKDGSRANFQILAALTRLRQICCHPGLVYPSYEGESGKLELLMELLQQAAGGGHRALVFSQFTGMLGKIARRLEAAGLEYFYLDGSTPPLNRLESVDRFNAGERDVFLISLRAGGTGLNLTGADVVMHYDPWWNPAVEDQATDRAHRIGQEKSVQVLRLITSGTIEEKIFALKERKQLDIDRVVAPGEGLAKGMTAEDLLELFEVT